MWIMPTAYFTPINTAVGGISCLVGDFNQDKQPDLLIGNLGLNGQCKPATTTRRFIFIKTLTMVPLGPILCLYIAELSYT